MITKAYKVLPGFVRYVEGIPKESNALAHDRFLGDASWTYLASGSRLIVHNTPDRIKQVDTFVQRIDLMQRRGIPPAPYTDSGVAGICHSPLRGVLPPDK